jgi:hypothetical protein
MLKGARRFTLLLHDQIDRLVGKLVDARAWHGCSSRHYGSTTPGVVASTQHQDGFWRFDGDPGRKRLPLLGVFIN